jgi:pyruvate,water dikinase
VRAYIERFGDVSPDGLKIEGMTLRENPVPLLREVGALARQTAGTDSITPRLRLLPTVAVSSEEVEVADRAEQRIAESLSTHTGRRVFFNYVLGLARQRLRDQQLYNFDRIRIVAVVRDLLMELGRRLYAVSAIDSPRHILYLDLDEVLAYVEGTAVTTDLRSLIAIRWREFSEMNKRSSPPSEMIITRGPVYIGQDTGR